MSQRPSGTPGQEGQAGQQIGDRYSSAIPWVAVVRAIGSAIDFGGGGANRQQRQLFRAAGGEIVHQGKGRWQFTYNGQRISEKAAIKLAQQYKRGQLPRPVNPNAPAPALPSQAPVIYGMAGGISVVDELEKRRKALEAAKKKAARRALKKRARKILGKAARRRMLARLGWGGWGVLIATELWDRFGQYVIPKPPPPIKLEPVKVTTRRMRVPTPPRIERTPSELDVWRRHASSVPRGAGGVRVLRPGEVPSARLERVVVTARRLPSVASVPTTMPAPRVIRLPGGRAIAVPTVPKELLQAAGLWAALRSQPAPRSPTIINPLTPAQPSSVGSFASYPVQALAPQPATKAAKCKCRTRKKSSKPTCRNPRTSSRTFIRDGVKYRSTTRRIQCRA